MKLYWSKRKINFCFRFKSTSIFLLIICCWDSNLFRKEFMLKISLLMFLRRIFSKALRASGRAPLLKFDGILFGSFKIWSPRTDLLPELRKQSSWLTSWLCSGIDLLTAETIELFSLPKAVLPLSSALYQSCCNKNRQTLLANSIVPDLFRWTLLSFKRLSVSMVSVWSTKVIPRSPHVLISRLFTSFALLTISDIVTAFVFWFCFSTNVLFEWPHRWI